MCCKVVRSFCKRRSIFYDEPAYVWGYVIPDGYLNEGWRVRLEFRLDFTPSKRPTMGSLVYDGIETMQRIVKHKVGDIPLHHERRKQLCAVVELVHSYYTVHVGFDADPCKTRGRCTLKPHFPMTSSNPIVLLVSFFAMFYALWRKPLKLPLIVWKRLFVTLKSGRNYKWAMCKAPLTRTWEGLRLWRLLGRKPQSEQYWYSWNTRWTLNHCVIERRAPSCTASRHLVARYNSVL